MPTPEELFARYAQHGDVEALSEVFDVCAPKLLRLAMHLLRSESEAEDVLQGTFLVAIEKRRKYDPKRPLLPWLATRIANAHVCWRRELGFRGLLHELWRFHQTLA